MTDQSTRAEEGQKTRGLTTVDPLMALYLDMKALAETSEARAASAEAEVERLKTLVADYEEAMADKRRLAREIDVAMHGEDGAARQPSLCDLVGPASALRDRVAVLESALRLVIPFIDFAAGDDLVFLGNPENGRPEMDAQAICKALADLLDVDLHEEGFEVWREEGFVAIAALKESTHV